MAQALETILIGTSLTDASSEVMEMHVEGLRELMDERAQRLRAPGDRQCRGRRAARRTASPGNLSARW